MQALLFEYSFVPLEQEGSAKNYSGNIMCRSRSQLAALRFCSADAAQVFTLVQMLCYSVRVTL